MSGVLPEVQSVLLSTRPADREWLRAAKVAFLVTLLVGAALALFAREPVPRSDLFLPIYQAALVVLEAVTAVLLFNRAAIGNSARLLVLAGGYVFSASMAVLHALSFPGLFAPRGLLGSGEQTTAWLYFLWHIGFALAVLAYALSPRSDVQIEPSAPRIAPRIVRTVVTSIAAAAVLMAVTTLGHDALPRVMSGDQDLPLKIVVAALTLAATMAAWLAVLRRGPPTVLDLWLLVVLAAWLCDVALAALFNAGRFSLGWYAGRVFGLIAAALLLVVFMAQEVPLMRQLVALLSAEGAQRRALQASMARVSRAEADASRALDELRQLASERLSAREDERRRLARDLHDELGQSLVALKIELDWLGQRASDSEVASRLESMASLAEGALESARRVIAQLRPPLLDELGFARGVGSLVEDFCARAGMQCRLRLEPADLELAEPLASTLYRIVQEALTNAAHHGRARRVEIEIRRSDDAVHARVSDDGEGFDPSVSARMGANGLVGMRERVLLLSGRIRINSAPGQGTVVDVAIPLNPSRAALPPAIAAE